MASLERRGESYRIVHRFAGRKYQHALGTDDRRQAESSLRRLEAGLYDLENGRSVLPPGADLALFLLSDGRITSKAEVEATPAILILGELSERYRAAHAGSVEANSLKTIATHFRHLERILGTDFPIGNLALGDLQKHIDRRRAEPGRNGKTVQGATARKEVTTLGAASGSEHHEDTLMGRRKVVDESDFW